MTRNFTGLAAAAVAGVVVGGVGAGVVPGCGVAVADVPGPGAGPGCTGSLLGRVSSQNARKSTSATPTPPATSFIRLAPDDGCMLAAKTLVPPSPLFGTAPEPDRCVSGSSGRKGAGTPNGCCDCDCASGLRIPGCVGGRRMPGVEIGVGTPPSDGRPPYGGGVPAGIGGGV